MSDRKDWIGTTVCDQNGNELSEVISAEISMSVDSTQTVRIEVPIVEMEIKDGKCNLVVNIGGR